MKPTNTTSEEWNSQLPPMSDSESGEVERSIDTWRQTVEVLTSALQSAGYMPDAAKREATRLADLTQYARGVSDAVEAIVDEESISDGAAGLSVRFPLLVRNLARFDKAIRYLIGIQLPGYMRQRRNRWRG